MKNILPLLGAWVWGPTRTLNSAQDEMIAIAKPTKTCRRPSTDTDGKTIPVAATVAAPVAAPVAATVVPVVPVAPLRDVNVIVAGDSNDQRFFQFLCRLG